MHKRLASLDPAAAAAIPKENVRRVVRALEVIEITGRPFTANLPRENSTKYPQAQQFGLVLDREKLDVRIDSRVEGMWSKGFVDEVESLIDQGLMEGKTARAALGYSQIIQTWYCQGPGHLRKKPKKRPRGQRASTPADKRHGSHETRVLHGWL